jgi:Chaperone of endosialidase
MYPSIQLTTAINPTSRSSRHCRTVAGLLIPLVHAFAWFAPAPPARAVCQEGCDLTNSNTFLGDDALLNDTTGMNNTASGSQALYSNTAGYSNTAIGSHALYSNTTGAFETATGEGALYSNTFGYGNSAFGGAALYNNTTGDNNTASGSSALYLNTTGTYNVANGVAALEEANGSENVAMGYSTLFNVVGSANTAIGDEALRNLTSGDNNIALGDFAGYNVLNGSNNIEIGNRGAAGDTKIIRIGKQGTQHATYIGGISGVTVSGGVGVIVGPTGQLGTIVSSARFKDSIKPMDKASEAILALQPVTFRYKKELDPDGIPQFGLVAEDVEKVNPDLVARDEQGKPYTVRYEAVNAMLLNEFLKEHSTVQDLKATVAQQQKQIEALTAGLQKVSAQVELSKSARQTVLNNQ